MKLILIKTEQKCKVVSLPKKHSYKDIKNLLEIDSPLTCVERKINEKYYDIWLDDEGLLKDEKLLTGCCLNASELLVGNLLIGLHDDEGNLIGLEDEDIYAIQRELIDTDEYLEFMKKDEVAIQYGEFGHLLVKKNGCFLVYKV